MLLLTAGAGGCGTKYPDMAFPPMGAGQGRIIFFREDMFAGSGVKPHIDVNDVIVGQSVPGEFCYADRPAGTYEVKCYTEGPYSTHVTLIAGKVSYVKTFITMGWFIGHILPVPVDEASALPILKDCRYSGPP